MKLLYNYSYEYFVVNGFINKCKRLVIMEFLFYPLSIKNIDLYCKRSYKNEQYLEENEYRSDIQYINYIEKSLKKFVRTGKINSRLTLNHIILLYS